MHSIEYDAEIDDSIFDPNIPDDYMLIDPANITEKAEMAMLCIVPFSVSVVAYKNIKKKRPKVSNIPDSHHKKQTDVSPPCKNAR
jgi:hypothetical protein